MQKYQIVVLDEEKERFFDKKMEALRYMKAKLALNYDCLFYQLINGAWVYQQ